MKTLIVIQARRGSRRFPNKVMMPLKGKPLLIRMIERVRAAKADFDIVVATTVERGDDQIRELCRDLGVKCYSGHPTDLLDRHYRAALEHRADVVAKIPSDCPLIDPAVITKVLEHYHSHAGSIDFVSNLHPASYPDGNDVEVMSMSVLEQFQIAYFILVPVIRGTKSCWVIPCFIKILLAWEPATMHFLPILGSYPYPRPSMQVHLLSPILSFLLLTLPDNRD